MGKKIENFGLSDFVWEEREDIIERGFALRTQTERERERDREKNQTSVDSWNHYG